MRQPKENALSLIRLIHEDSIKRQWQHLILQEGPTHLW